MKPFEDELKNALRHVEPPTGFAQRVMERARNEARSKPSVADRLRALFLPKPVRWAAAMGFVCLVIVVGVLRYRDTQREEERMQGEIASAQARLALQIASTKLNAVFRDAARSSRRHLEN